jgi:uncharacterized protein (TIGR03086 family)
MPANPAQSVLDDDILFDDDPRAVIRQAVATAAEVIGGIRPDQLHAPTPCDEYDVARLLQHLLGVLRHLTVLGRGEQREPSPVPPADVADDGWLEAWSAAGEELRAAWRDDATLTRTITLPWADMSGAGTLVAYTMEITVHTWDLAHATGQPVAWDDLVVAVAHGAGREHLPVRPRGGSAPFGEVRATGPDAPMIDRLVAWSGRQP